MSAPRAERGARWSHTMMRPAEFLPPRLITGVPTAIALVVMVLGVIDVVVVLMPQRAARLRALTDVLPLGVIHEASAATAIAGLLLVMRGHGLRRRKRRAWRAALALSVLTMGLHVIKGLDLEEAGATLVFTVLLLALSRQFYAEGDPTTRW